MAIAASACVALLATYRVRCVPVASSLVRRYLARIGLTPAAARAAIAGSPSVELLGELIERHVRTVPFENLDQHTHKATPRHARVARCPPSLSFEHAVHKVVLAHRGGFCYEINFAFCWLLRQLGYTVRICTAQVARPNGTFGFPSHCTLLVRAASRAKAGGEGEDGSSWFVADPGFGDPPRVPVIAPVSETAVAGARPCEQGGASNKGRGGEQDQDVDRALYRVVHNEPACGTGTADFDFVLMRRGPGGDRVLGSCPTAAARTARGGGNYAGDVDSDSWSPVFRFCVPSEIATGIGREHECGPGGHPPGKTTQSELDSGDLKAGLGFVLSSPDIFFTMKRVCCMATATGHVTLCENRVQFTDENGAVRVEPLADEAAWRDALASIFGINLGDQLPCSSGSRVKALDVLV